MRLHRNLVYTTIDSLNAIFNEGEYADKVVARALKKDKRWGSSDRKFVAETIYEVVRWKRLYAEIAKLKNLLTEKIYGEFLLFGRFYVAIQFPIGDNWKELRNEKLKENLTSFLKSEKCVNLFRTGWMNWV